MAACGSLQHIFESPLPENPTLIESLTSWNKIKSITPPPIEQSSFTEIFGELHFKESSSSSPSSSPLPLSSSSSSSSSSFFIDFNNTQPAAGFENLLFVNKSPSLDSFSCAKKKSSYTNGHKNSDSFSSMNSESLQLCTEGLGFESCDDVEDLKSEINNNNNRQIQEEEEDKAKISMKHTPPSGNSIFRRSPRRSNGQGAFPFPPPISCIGKTGKPWVSFKSYRQDGRFVLKEVRIPTQEFLHACREDGRLKLHFVQPDDDELLEEEDEEAEEDDDDDVDDEMGNEDDGKRN